MSTLRPYLIHHCPVASPNLAERSRIVADHFFFISEEGRGPKKATRFAVSTAEGKNPRRPILRAYLAGYLWRWSLSGLVQDERLLRRATQAEAMQSPDGPVRRCRGRAHALWNQVAT